MAAELIVKNTNDYYFNENENVLPRSIASRNSFLNAMKLDIAMGGSTNTVLHLLAAAHEAKVDFSMKDIDSLSRQTPVLCKVSPSSKYHIEDVNRAGGVMGILNELNKANLIDNKTNRVDYKNLEEALKANDITTDSTIKKYLSAPCNKFNLIMGSQDEYYPTLDTDREKGCIREANNAYSKDGGLAILYGNLAPNGCVVKTAGVDDKIL